MKTGLELFFPHVWPDGSDSEVWSRWCGDAAELCLLRPREVLLGLRGLSPPLTAELSHAVMRRFYNRISALDEGRIPDWDQWLSLLCHLQSGPKALEHVVSKALELGAPDAPLKALIANQPFDLVSASQDTLSPLFQSLKANRFGLLRSLLSSPHLYTENLGILNKARQAFLQLEGKLSVEVAARPSSSLDSFDQKLPTEIIAQIYSLLGAQDQLHLSQTSSRLRTLGADIVALLYEFRSTFLSLARSPRAIDQAKQLKASRKIAKRLPTIDYDPGLFQAVAHGQLTTVSSELDPATAATPPHNPVNTHLIAASLRVDTLALWILLQAYAPESETLKSLEWTAIDACKWGATDILQCLLLADPEGRHFAYPHLLHNAIIHRAPGSVNLLAPRVTKEHLQIALATAITSVPEDTRCALALVKHGAIVTGEQLKTLCLTDEDRLFKALLTPAVLQDAGPDLLMVSCYKQSYRMLAVILALAPRLLDQADLQAHLSDMMSTCKIDRLYGALQDYSVVVNPWFKAKLFQTATREWSLPVLKHIISRYYPLEELMPGRNLRPLAWACKNDSKGELVQYLIAQSAPFDLDALKITTKRYQPNWIVPLLMLPDARATLTAANNGLINIEQLYAELEKAITPTQGFTFFTGNDDCYEAISRLVAPLFFEPETNQNYPLSRI